MKKVIDLIPEGKAFDLFIAKEREKDLRYLINYFGLSQADAEDIYQEASIAFWNNIKEGRLTELTASLPTYLLQICKNQALNLLRKEQKSTFNGYLSSLNSVIDSVESPYNDNYMDEVLALADEEPDAMAELLNQLESLIKMLPEPCKTLLWGRFWEKLSHQELAAILGYSSASGSKTQTSRCLSKVKSRVENLLRKLL
ncbi:MAG: RNA polymerase sigma factor [Phocaeicola sp.]